MVVWANPLLAGSLSNQKIMYLQDAINNILHNYPETAVALVVQTNRGGDGDGDGDVKERETDSSSESEAEDEKRSVALFGRQNTGNKRMGTAHSIRTAVFQSRSQGSVCQPTRCQVSNQSVTQLSSHCCPGQCGTRSREASPTALRS